MVKVTDFGLCNNFTDDMMMVTFCGSMVYSPPEVLLQEPYSGPNADVWSLALCECSSRRHTGVLGAFMNVLRATPSAEHPAASLRAPAPSPAPSPASS